MIQPAQDGDVGLNTQAMERNQWLFVYIIVKCLLLVTSKAMVTEFGNDNFICKKKWPHAGLSA